MKVLLISRGIPSCKSPMWGNFELDQARALKGIGHEVVVMSIDRRIRVYWRKIGVTKEVVDGITMYNYFFPLPYRFLPRIIHNYCVDFFAEKLYAYIIKEQENFDLIHAHYLPNIRLATVLKEKFFIPVVGTEHWSELKRKKIRRSVFRDGKEAYSKVDHLITVSAPLKHIIQDNFKVDSSFVGCVIDGVFGYKPLENDGVIRFIAVGSLFPIKGFDILIESFSKAKFNKKAELYIVGEGNQRSKLESLVTRFNLKGRVFLVGRKTRREIMDLFSVSSVYVLSSKSENFATACMEALSSGLPAIMTKCGGPEDFVDKSNSLLVGVDNVQEISQAMSYISENIEQYNRKEIASFFKLKYSPNAIALEIEKIYNKVKNNR